MEDPLIAAITSAVTFALERGIEATPKGDGWFIRLAPADANKQSVAETGVPGGRNW